MQSFFFCGMFVLLFSCFAQGFRQQALAVSTDPEHRFELALHLGELKTAYDLALEAEVRDKFLVVVWQQLCKAVLQKGTLAHHLSIV